MDFWIIIYVVDWFLFGIVAIVLLLLRYSVGTQRFPKQNVRIELLC